MATYSFHRLGEIIILYLGNSQVSVYRTIHSGPTLVSEILLFSCHLYMYSGFYQLITKLRSIILLRKNSFITFILSSIVLYELYCMQPYLRMKFCKGFHIKVHGDMEIEIIFLHVFSKI